MCVWVCVCVSVWVCGCVCVCDQPTYLGMKVIFVNGGQDPAYAAISTEYKNTKLLKSLKELHPVCEYM